MYIYIYMQMSAGKSAIHMFILQVASSSNICMQFHYCSLYPMITRVSLQASRVCLFMHHACVSSGITRVSLHASRVCLFMHHACVSSWITSVSLHGLHLLFASRPNTCPTDLLHKYFATKFHYMHAYLL